MFKILKPRLSELLKRYAYRRFPSEKELDHFCKSQSYGRHIALPALAHFFPSSLGPTAADLRRPIDPLTKYQFLSEVAHDTIIHVLRERVSHLRSALRKTFKRIRVGAAPNSVPHSRPAPRPVPVPDPLPASACPTLEVACALMIAVTMPPTADSSWVPSPFCIRSTWYRLMRTCGYSDSRPDGHLLAISRILPRLLKAFDRSQTIEGLVRLHLVLDEQRRLALGYCPNRSRVRRVLLRPVLAELPPNPRPRRSFPRKSLGIATWNPNSLNQSQLAECTPALAEIGASCLAIQETRLKLGQRPSPVPDTMHWFGWERTADSGGGVGWLVDKSLRPQLFPNPPDHPSGIERLWIQIPSFQGPIRLCSVYWPPEQTPDIDSFIDEIQSHAACASAVFLAGDLNAAPPGRGGRRTARDRALATLLQKTNLELVSDRTVPTHRKDARTAPRVIDHILFMRGDLALRPLPLTRVHSQGVLVMTPNGHRLVHAHVDISGIGIDTPVMTTTRYRTRLLRDSSVRQQFQSRVRDECATAPTDKDEATVLLNAVTNALTSEVGQNRPRPQKQAYSWWTVRCSMAYEKLRTNRNRWNHTRRAIFPSQRQQRRHRRSFLAARSEFRKEVRQSKKAAYFRQIVKVAECSSPAAPALYQRVKRLKRPSVPAAVPPESLASTWNGIWAARPLPNETVHLAEIDLLRNRDRAPSDRDDALCKDFTMRELTNALALCRRGKSPDFFGHDYDVLRALPSEALDIFLRICNRLWQTEEIPSLWLEGWIRFLPKTEGRQDSNPTNNRPIALLSVWYKLLERMLWTRIQAWEPQWAETQAGFRPGRNCVAQAGALHMMREWLQKENEVAYAAFLDIAKAFDSVSHTAVQLKMLRMGIPPRASDLICRLLQHHRNHVVGGITENVVEVGRGAPQGSVLGPFVFLVMINDLPQYLEAKVPEWCDERRLIIRSQLWADDTLLVSQRFTVLQALLDASYEWSRMWGLEFNPTKSAILPLGAHFKKHEPHIIAASFNLGGVPIPMVSKFKHLGVLQFEHRDKESRSQSHWAVGKKSSVKGMASRLWSLISEPDALPLDRTIRIIRTVLLPQILYGSEIELPPDYAQSAVNNVLRTALGGHKSTPNEVLLYMSGLWRVETLGRKRRLKALVGWCLPSYASPEPAAAIALAKEHDLKWWRQVRKDLRALALEGHYEAIANSLDLVRALPPDEMLKRCSLILRSWTRLVHTRLDTRERTWQLERWPELKQIAPRTTAMRPICRAVQSDAALFLFLPFMAPKYKDKHRDYTIPPCYLCGAEGGDRMQHMVCDCESPYAVAARRAMGVDPASCTLRALLAMDPNTPAARIAPLNALAAKLRFQRYCLSNGGHQRRNALDARNRRQRRRPRES